MFEFDKINLNETILATSQQIESAVHSIAENSQKGAIEAGEINKRSEKTKQSVQHSQKKPNEIFVNTKIELEKAIESSKINDIVLKKSIFIGIYINMKLFKKVKSLKGKNKYI